MITIEMQVLIKEEILKIKMREDIERISMIETKDPITKEKIIDATSAKGKAIWQEIVLKKIVTSFEKKIIN